MSFFVKFLKQVIFLLIKSFHIIEGILAEAQRQKYDLIVIGTSEEYSSSTRLFGSVDDWVVEQVNNSLVLLVRQNESVAIDWKRKHLKMMWRTN
jgi:nucleotide-binding universal stress UspA family protein